MHVLNENVLVINKNFFPLCVITAKTAMKLLFTNKAVVMDKDYVSYEISDWENLADKEGKRLIRTPSKSYVLPEVIRLLGFDHFINKPINLTRQNVFIRDDFKCQYCLKSDVTLTIDHVIPKSRASDFNMTSQQINAWENVVACCKECNSKKDNKTPKEADMKLNKKPKQPNYNIQGFDVRKIKDSWKLYMNMR